MNMKISEFITELQKYQDRYGDLDIYHINPVNHECYIADIRNVYDDPMYIIIEPENMYTE